MMSRRSFLKNLVIGAGIVSVPVVLRRDVLSRGETVPYFMDDIEKRLTPYREHFLEESITVTRRNYLPLISVEVRLNLSKDATPFVLYTDLKKPFTSIVKDKGDDRHREIKEASLTFDLENGRQVFWRLDVRVKE